MGVNRIRLTIDQLVLRGFEPSDRKALVEGLRGELARVLADPAMQVWARPHRTPVLATGADAPGIRLLWSAEVWNRPGASNRKGVEAMRHAVLARKGAAPGLQSTGAPKSGSTGLRVSEPYDAFEQEASRAANEVMATDTAAADWSLSKIGVGTALQRKCACGGSSAAEEECEECQKKGVGAPLVGAHHLQRRAASQAETAEVPPIVYEALRSPGQPLGPEPRAFFEPRFGHDFSQVRVHTDAQGAQSARAVNALAYTVGSHVVFGDAQYTSRLLAHELAHVVQQSRTNTPFAPPAPNLAPEQHADQAAGAQRVGVTDAGTPSGSFPLTKLRTGRRLQRSPADGSNTQPETVASQSAPGLIVDQGATASGPEQMPKTQFLAELRHAVSAAAAETLAGTQGGKPGAPWIGRVFSFYEAQGSRELEHRGERSALPPVGPAPAALPAGLPYHQDYARRFSGHGEAERAREHHEHLFRPRQLDA